MNSKRPEIRTPPGTSLRTGTTPLINAGGKNAYRIGPHTTYRTARQIPIYRTIERYRAGQGKNDHRPCTSRLGCPPCGQIPIWITTDHLIPMIHLAQEIGKQKNACVGRGRKAPSSAGVFVSRENRRKNPGLLPRSPAYRNDEREGRAAGG